jgi:hypothetical protein
MRGGANRVFRIPCDDSAGYDGCDGGTGQYGSGGDRGSLKADHPLWN